MALPILQCPGIRSKVEKGDKLEVDIEKGTIKLVKSGEVLQAEETPWILMEIYKNGGMLGWIKNRRHEYHTISK